MQIFVVFAVLLLFCVSLQTIMMLNEKWKTSFFVQWDLLHSYDLGLYKYGIT